MKTIRTAAVIGSGVMGAGIAAHLANAGIRVRLLDRVPDRLTPQEEASGATTASPAVRNRLATDALARLLKTNPAPFYEERGSRLVTPGNVEDDFESLRDADWIIEAITERLDWKKELLARIERVWTPGTFVSSNTSGISIAAMAEAIAGPMRAFFLGTHFFNPPRHMPLVEIIPGPDTDAEVVTAMRDVLERRLGKGVVVAKDTPNFIANRIGTYGLLATLKLMAEGGYTVDEVDAVTGPALGRPKSATFRTLDLVGLDTFVHVANNVYERTDDPAEKEAFAVPDVLADLVSRGRLGEKTGEGFYKKVKTGQGSRILSLDLATMEYAASVPVRSPSLEAAKSAKGAAAKCRAIVGGTDRLARLAWGVVKHVLVYAADKADEIAGSIADVDAAMKLGFHWELGPFELWDALGLRETAARMEADGMAVPGWVRAWIDAGNESFYARKEGRTAYVRNGAYAEAEERPETISLKALKVWGKTVLSNGGASLIDIGEDVACLEFHSPNNAIGADILTMIRKSAEEVERNYRGLVVANEGRNFCVGANLMLLLMEAQEEEWDEVDRIIRLFQQAMLELKRLGKPVVAAPHRMTLGGGVEVCMAADRVRAHAETYYGLVEAGVGLIPAGGGTKEMALRAAESAGDDEESLQAAINRAFETIGMAKVSGSAPDAVRLGLMRAVDRHVMNRDRQLFEARRTVLELDRDGYAPPGGDGTIRVVGRNGRAVLELGAYTLKEGGYISDHDYTIARKLARVLSGGDVPGGTSVSERHLLDLEREAFLSLCGEPKTQARMQHMLATGKPLRN
ncbi:3-hydroxyacyl-CoA dehydrogenase/enoyl-CoA hydratase family protein [Paenibacillus flagellatus]|uniref:3-hydroxyacyl-CoA dehydrogenase n=1 Tax=Paenibacillus flagellatus TaxID=2211139 RepID=A0A2V5KUZ2_9BACL|nr:3-hydroxyacyl-CoA dehydrogenase/enoyl-CoA hydratase family protein [Paenibacillus flagellatus]PYI55847.1 3-hydroxyacyl-CoA dehydrogenase [Paenibacillus flagellatus]